MKKLTLFIMAFILLFSLFSITALATEDTFEYSISVTANGQPVEDLTALPEGTEVTVTVSLTCTSIADGETYEAWGVELDIVDLGLDYLSGSGFSVLYKGKETSIKPSNYIVGGATGTGIIRFYIITTGPNDDFILGKTVSISAKYVVSDSAISQVTAPTPILFLKGATNEADVQPAEPVTPIVVPPYVVTLDAAGGTVSGSAVLEVEKGSSTVLPEAVYDGHSFSGWTDGTNIYIAGSNFTPSGDVTLTAIWNETTPGVTDKFTVIFDANGGTLEGDASLTINKDAEITLPYATFEGYILESWTDGINTFPAGETYTVTKDVTFVAVWKTNDQSDTSSEGITVTLLDPAVGDLTATGVRDSNGIVTVTVTDGTGEPVSNVPGGLLLTIRNTGNGNVAAVIDPANGKVLDIVEKSYVENGVAYILLDAPATIRITDNAKRFTDMSTGQWFNSAVVFASSHELFQGVSTAEFAPGKEMTRGMLVTVLWRLEGKPVGVGSGFDDVPDGLYYSEAVRWASGVGIVNGYGDGTFLPNKSITREQIAAVMYRYMNYLGYDTSARSSIASFSDGGDVSGWAIESVEWNVAAGIITGRADGTLDPQNTATRAEVATLLMRIVKEMVI